MSCGNFRSLTRARKDWVAGGQVLTEMKTQMNEAANGSVVKPVVFFAHLFGPIALISQHAY